jgi:hypothetical protein
MKARKKIVVEATDSEAFCDAISIAIDEYLAGNTGERDLQERYSAVWATLLHIVNAYAVPFDVLRLGMRPESAQYLGRN